ncbi:MAG: 2-dehydro-3-deoxygalactonokinase [Pseudomonas sp.]|nr:2-dehydro-3-deoxygalactonokinase [Pseudomonas sp.]
MQAQLIALDWGTTSLRAYLLGHAGRVLDQRSLSLGIMQLPTEPRTLAGQTCSNGFELAFDEACGDWLRAQPGLPLIACGMVGSAQGWREAAYCPTPARVADLGASLQLIESISGAVIHVVLGVVQHLRLPNVMRGEETPSARPDAEPAAGYPPRHLADRPARQPFEMGEGGLDGCIQHFDTFMTGEVYAALCAHTILGRTQQRGLPFDGRAFDRGVQVALSSEGDIGLLSTLFSARTLGLTGQLSGAEQPDYLSGLMIGHELRVGAHQPSALATGHPDR